jgi:DNA-binding transcriptional LysR family regulator
MLEIKNLNLNTLVVLNTLLSERNVSRTAEKLRLTQPTISNTLKQLRVIFDDDLLIRGPGNKMILSYRAKKLIGPVTEAMNKIQDVFVDLTPFDPQKMKYNFKLGLSDFSSVIILTRMMKIIKGYSGNISISVEHLNDLKSYDEFTAKGFDIAVGSFNCQSDLLVSENLFHTDMICLASKDHCAFQNNRLDMDTFINLQFMDVCYREDLWKSIDNAIFKASGKKRNIALKIPHLLVALSMLKDSRLACITVRKVVEKYQNIFDLSIRELPFKLPRLDYSLIWKKSDNNNPAYIWLRSQIMELFKIERQ